MFLEFLGNESGLVFNLDAGRINPQEISLVFICLEADSIPEPQCGRKDQANKNPNDTIGNGTRDLPACSSVPQSTSPPGRTEVEASTSVLPCTGS